MRALISVLIIAAAAFFASPAAAQTSLATVESNDGALKMSVEKITRKNNVVTIKGKMENLRPETEELTIPGEKLYLLHEEKGIKYFPLKDEDKRLLVSNHAYGGFYFNIKKGESNKFWAKFTAPPPDVKSVNIVFEGFELIESAPISDEG